MLPSIWCCCALPCLTACPAADQPPQAYALEKTIGDEAQEEVALEWLDVFQDYLGDETGSVEEEGVNIVYFTSRSLDDALSESVAGEIFLFVATCE